MSNLLTLIKGSNEVLGLNERNVRYIKLNSGRKRFADNKLLTKRILKNSNIPTPSTFGVIKNAKDLDRFDFEKLPKSFVLKPSKGVKGAGINIYYNRLKNGSWILATKERHTVEDIKSQVLNILEGQFSLGFKMQPSAAVFEERVQMHPAFKQYSYRGIPDIRIIVYRGIPVMGMLRLPTEESGGKANINRGAIGVGIDMARGVTTSAIKNGLQIEQIVDKKLALSGIKIPFWTKILRIAHQCQVATELGFLGVDIIIDRDKGPMVVEINARPGLGIQAANQDGLKDRLQKVRRIKSITESKAVRLAKDLFGGEIDEELESITGRELIGLTEKVCFVGKSSKEVCVNCKIDTGAESSSIDETIARSLGYGEAIDRFKDTITEEVKNMVREERLKYIRKIGIHQDIASLVPIKSASGEDYRLKVEISAKIGTKEFIMKATVADRSNLTYPVIIGKKDLSGFLIDATKRGGK